ncbi:uncharacterized protein TNCV_1476261 [Trichonephila clavipes]|nr:uncharacterized protein TNCV_1476261 [Trichonephila clavipes]
MTHELASSKFPHLTDRKTLRFDGFNVHQPLMIERFVSKVILSKHDNSAIVALRKFRTLKGLRKGSLTAKNLRLMVTKFEETGSLNVRSGRGKKPVSAEAIEKVALQVEEDKSSNVLASTSASRVAEALDLPRSTFLARLEVDPEWPWNILWTDEAHFHLDGSVNTHNCRIWETDNPHSTLRVPLHSPKVTVWCGFSASFILGPYFFEELGAGGPVTCSITGQRYASLLRNKIIPDLQARQCLSRIIFMQDGAPPHITRCVTDVLKHHFTEERVISRQFRHLWPPRSLDLNSCDFWLWGHLKQLVSCDQPKTLPDLKDSISRHVLNLSQSTLRSTVEHDILRFQIVAENDGHHVEHLLL